MSVGHNGITAIRNGRAVWEPNPCSQPHHDYPETLCTEPAGHYRRDVDPHAGPLIINGRECGGAAWDEPRKQHMTDRIPLDHLTSDQYDNLHERLEHAEAAIERVRAALPLYDKPVLGDRSRGMQMGWDRARQAALAALDREQPAPGTAATDDAKEHGAPTWMRDGVRDLRIPEQPREHCGHLSPETALTTPRTECVLRPGHPGSHADDVGCRWYPITEQEQPMPTCTATIQGPHTPGGRLIQCTREAGHPANHVGPQQGDDGKVLWTDHNAGATPHKEPS